MDARLAYLVVEAPEVEAWATFGTEVLGLQRVDRADGRVDLRMDERARRFILTEGPRDDVECLAWEVDDLDFGPTVDRLRRAGVEVSEGDGAARGVERLVRFKDPGRVPIELVSGAELAQTPFESAKRVGGFKTGAQGMGHVVVRAFDKAQSLRFYQELLGFRLSDHIVCEFWGHPVDITFLHANSRHHSLAVGGPQPKRIHHIMLEVERMDDVGLCYDRALRKRLQIANTLGKHPNDGMFSFYAHTPSDFQFEFGWGGVEIDDATWTPTTHHCVSEWGHHPPGYLARRPKK